MRKLTLIITTALILIALAWLAVKLYPSLSDYYTYARTAIRFPYSLDYGEGPLLDQTLRLSHFQNVYSRDLTKPPYTISNYPPLFILAQVPFAWIFGPAFWYGRLISILSVLLTGLFIGLTLFALTREWAGALVGGVLIVTFPYIQHWSMFNRIDELALVLSWAALFVTVRFVGLRPPSPASKGGPIRSEARSLLRSKGFWIGVVLFVASIYTRQTYALAAPVAAFFWMIFGSQGVYRASGYWRVRLTRAVLLGAAVGSLSLLLFLLFDLLTLGGFYINVVVANVNAFSWETVNNYVRDIRTNLYPFLLLAAGFLVLGALFSFLEFLVPEWQAARQVDPGKPAPLKSLSLWALVLPYVLLTSAGSITVGKDGSNVNYLLEFCAALAFAAGALLCWAGRLQWPWARVPLQGLIIFVIAFQANLNQEWMHTSFAPYLLGRAAGISDTTRLEQIVKDTQGIVLADEYMGLVPLAGKSLYFQPFEFKQLSDALVWDQAPFLHDIASQKFDVILWYKSRDWDSIGARWTLEQQATINTYYLLDQVIGEVYVLRPAKQVNK